MPDRLLFMPGPGRVAALLLAVAGSGSGVFEARAQSRPAVSVGGGLNFLMSPRWIFADGAAFVTDAVPALKAQLHWPIRQNLEALGLVRTGAWASQATSLGGKYHDFESFVYQAGGGLRYTDFLYLGRWLEPFVGLHASAGYVTQTDYLGRSYSGSVPGLKRFTALVSAELGLQFWVSSHGGPVLSVEAHRSLWRYHAPYTLTRSIPQGGDPPLQYDVRFKSLPGHGAVLVGWRWQLPPPRTRWHTPRYHEQPAPEE